MRYTKGSGGYAQNAPGLNRSTHGPGYGINHSSYLLCAACFKGILPSQQVVRITTDIGQMEKHNVFNYSKRAGLAYYHKDCWDKRYSINRGSADALAVSKELNK